MEPCLEDRPVTMACREVDVASSPQSKITDDPWATGHYRCTLTGADESTVTVTVGCDEGPPGAEDVIAVLGVEAATVEAFTSFEDWAVALGYDPDSRTAERIYRAARRRAKGLRDVIGGGGYRRLLRESEASGLVTRAMANGDG